MDIGQPMATWPKKGPERPKIAMRWTIHMLSLVRAKTETKINHKKRMKKEFISRHTGFEILEVFLEPFMICILTVQKIYNSTTSNRSSLKSTRRPLKSRHVRKALQGMCRSQNVQYHCIVTFSKMADDHKEVLSGCWGLESNKNGT